MDAKSDIRRDIALPNNTILLPQEDSVDVKWGYSQVEETLKLLKTVYDSGKQYDFIWLISGQDYPIKPIQYIDDYLEKRKNHVLLISFLAL